MSDWNRYGSERGYDYGSSSDDSGSSGGVREKAEQGMERARDTTKQATERVRDTTKQATERVRNTTKQATERARGGFDHYFHQHPLLISMGAFALGITIGMLIPGSRQEEEWMGESAHRLRDHTRETAGKVGDVARSTFEEARDTAREELEGSGLDPQHLKESAKEAAGNVREAAERTAEEARRTAEEEAERKNLR